MYLFAYPDNPLIRASISSSATALGYPSKNFDYAGTNFTFVAKAMGCDFEDAALELQCMRQVPMPRLINFIGHYQDNSTLVNTSQPTLNFGRQGKLGHAESREPLLTVLSRLADDKYVFTDAQYLAKYAKGDLAKVPKMIGTTAREGAPLLPWPANSVSGGPPLQSIIATTLNAFVCPSYNTSLQRDKAGLTTYRYEWAGNFSNIDGGVTWLGAYHYSDLYMFFGTYPIAPGPIPEFEVETSRTMQNLLSDFVRYPECLPRHGWPDYHPLAANGGELVRFGADGKTVQIVSGDSVAGACHIPDATYNTTP